ncbi:MAG TPA: 4'-phosphopantetheinyl transferase superfamily protein, partial [Roseateles sp.]|uniref:4'-phosphopantetheinyl transferase family protein n=1 Tax=Roseateles sp. TaxID=1971397 RepID=UPI002EDB23FD
MLCLLAAEPEVRAGMPAPAGWLTLSEAARLRALGSEARRDTFLAGRWLARRAIQGWSGSAALPALEVADSGACVVAGVDGGHVSISHSAGVVACAASEVPVGIDIESLSRPRDHLALAEAVHGPAQREQLAALPPEARARDFLRWWTLKEAWLKARGRGLDFALMRRLAFDADASGDTAVTCVGDLVLALAADPELPPQIVGVPGAAWQRSRTRVLA